VDVPDSLVFHLVVSGLDLDDDTQLESLQWSDADVYPDERDGLLTLTVRSVAPVYSAVDFVLDAVSHLTAAVTGLTVDAVDQDLVATTDIAHRIGRSREMVRMWSTGQRGAGGFPTALGVVNAGRRVWDWASVNAWLLSNTDAGRPECGLTRAEFARIADLIQGRRIGALSP
jgi:hypothetical protein